VATLLGQCVAVEDDAEVRQRFHRGHGLGDDGLGHLRVAQAGGGRNGVRGMGSAAVTRPHRRGDAALS
jgi:hypothetical protein